MRRILTSFLVLLSTSTWAECTWNGFRFPEQWKIELQGHVHGTDTMFEVLPGQVTFRNTDELESFVRETVEVGLERVARVNPCLLNDRIEKFGSLPLTLSDKYTNKTYLFYRPAKKSNVIGFGSRKAELWLGTSYPSISERRFRNHILHGVLHHLGFDNQTLEFHETREMHERESFVFQDFRGFMQTIDNDLVYACTQVAYPVENFLELQGAEFPRSCQSCRRGQIPEEPIMGLIMRTPDAEDAELCEGLKAEYLETHGFSPTEAEESLMEIDEVKELRRETERRKKRIRNGQFGV